MRQTRGYSTPLHDYLTLLQGPLRALERMRRQMLSALAVEARRLETEISARLPLALRDKFYGRLEETSFDADPGAYPAKLLGLARLVTNPEDVIGSLDSEPWCDA